MKGQTYKAFVVKYIVDKIHVDSFNDFVLLQHLNCW